jgi:hypothetical protein
MQFLWKMPAIASGNIALHWKHKICLHIKGNSRRIIYLARLLNEGNGSFITYIYIVGNAIDI